MGGADRDTVMIVASVPDFRIAWPDSAAGLTNLPALRIFFRVMKFHPPTEQVSNAPAGDQQASSLFQEKIALRVCLCYLYSFTFTSVISRAIAAVTVWLQKMAACSFPVSGYSDVLI
ncbi:hypothetical protein [Nitrosomonas sp.]|uniref:hypothetical protein n=1 Tax=Nitrosomonas sp. TaxID=42353 RepID=UPI003305F72E